MARRSLYGRGRAGDSTARRGRGRLSQRRGGAGDGSPNGEGREPLTSCRPMHVRCTQACAQKLYWRPTRRVPPDSSGSGAPASLWLAGAVILLGRCQCTATVYELFIRIQSWLMEQKAQLPLGNTSYAEPC